PSSFESRRELDLTLWLDDLRRIVPAALAADIAVSNSFARSIILNALITSRETFRPMFLNDHGTAP
ncbi:MAG: hypothetical protein ABL958_20060, partial [Bdellovibrionia bacterium]